MNPFFSLFFFCKARLDANSSRDGFGTTRKRWALYLKRRWQLGIFQSWPSSNSASSVAKWQQRVLQKPCLEKEVRRGGCGESSFPPRHVADHLWILYWAQRTESYTGDVCSLCTFSWCFFTSLLLLVLTQDQGQHYLPPQKASRHRPAGWRGGAKAHQQHWLTTSAVKCPK